MWLSPRGIMSGAKYKDKGERSLRDVGWGSSHQRAKGLKVIPRSLSCVVYNTEGCGRGLSGEVRGSVPEMVASPLSVSPSFPSNETLIFFWSEMCLAEDHISQSPLQPDVACDCVLINEPWEKLMRVPCGKLNKKRTQLFFLLLSTWDEDMTDGWCSSSYFGL